MDSNVLAFLFAVGTVVLAEMGDKTQLLAMAFAAKYKASKVMLGVLIATVFNHALAVAIGNLITQFQSAQVWIQGVASLSFVLFGLWTIRGDKLEGEENRAGKYGAIATVAIAFFLAEMGDKTQLATIALATKFPTSPFGVLLGTTTGMMIADGVGIIIGVVMCKRIPERTIKLISAGVFILFGFTGSYQVLREELKLDMGYTIATLALLLIITGVCAYLLMRKDHKIAESAAVSEYCGIKEEARQSEDDKANAII